MKEYPKYKHLAPKEPALDQFSRAWKHVFEHEFKDCVITGIDQDEYNLGFYVETPTSSIINGGFGFHTEEPVLEDGEDFYYHGCGCTWGADSNGDRFYRIDPDTNIPTRLEYALSVETIRRYFSQNGKKINHLPGSQILINH